MSNFGNLTLKDLVDNSRTDKNTTHSYLDLYEMLLSPKKDSAKRVLEIGVQTGGSIKLWADYFTNAIVEGIDIMHANEMWPVIQRHDRIVLHTSKDAYDEKNIIELFSNSKFDMILDDGPHTLDSMKYFIILYSQVLTDDGILILEDIQNIDWIPILRCCVPENLQHCVEVYDLRSTKGRYDDIVLVIKKRG